METNAAILGHKIRTTAVTGMDGSVKGIAIVLVPFLMMTAVLQQKRCYGLDPQSSFSAFHHLSGLILAPKMTGISGQTPEWIRIRCHQYSGSETDKKNIKK